jgi:hypothetical protein
VLKKERRSEERVGSKMWILIVFWNSAYPLRSTNEGGSPFHHSDGGRLMNKIISTGKTHSSKVYPSICVRNSRFSARVPWSGFARPQGLWFWQVCLGMGSWWPTIVNPICQSGSHGLNGWWGLLVKEGICKGWRKKTSNFLHYSRHVPASFLEANNGVPSCFKLSKICSICKLFFICMVTVLD